MSKDNSPNDGEHMTVDENDVEFVGPDAGAEEARAGMLCRLKDGFVGKLFVVVTAVGGLLVLANKAAPNTAGAQETRIAAVTDSRGDGSSGDVEKSEDPKTAFYTGIAYGADGKSGKEYWRENAADTPGRAYYEGERQWCLTKLKPGSYGLIYPSDLGHADWDEDGREFKSSPGSRIIVARMAINVSDRIDPKSFNGRTTIDIAKGTLVKTDRGIFIMPKGSIWFSLGTSEIRKEIFGNENPEGIRFSSELTRTNDDLSAALSHLEDSYAENGHTFVASVNR